MKQVYQTQVASIHKDKFKKLNNQTLKLKTTLKDFSHIMIIKQIQDLQRIEKNKTNHLIKVNKVYMLKKYICMILSF